jgi:plasmid stabilization system protein ParE
MKYVLLPRAVEDLQWFRRYYRIVFPDGRGQSSRRFAKSLNRLRATPMIGHPIDDTNYREYAIAGLPFSFVYEIVDDRIEILRLWDQRSQRGDDWLDR